MITGGTLARVQVRFVMEAWYGQMEVLDLNQR